MKSILSNNFQLRLESNQIPSRTAPVPAALPTCSHSIQSTLKRSNPSQDSPGDCSYLWRISDESLTNLWGISQSSSKVSNSPELKSESISRVEMPRQCPNNQRGESRKNLERISQNLAESLWRQTATPTQGAGESGWIHLWLSVSIEC